MGNRRYFLVVKRRGVKHS